MNQQKSVDVIPADVAAIFFDFGDTLVTLDPPREKLFARAAQTVGLELDETAIKRAYQIVDFHNKYSSVHVKNREAFYEQYNQQLTAALGLESYLPQLSSALAAEFRNTKRWTLFPEVPAVLARLQELGYRLGLVANWDAKLASLAEELGIREAFATIIASAVVGAEKPDAEIFLAARAELGFTNTAQKILYVGNEYVADVVGPRRAGLIPVLIDRNNFFPHADCPRFASLTDWLGSFRAE